jgi:hypothetical protein
MAAGGGGADVLILGVGAAGVGIVVATDAATAVDLDAVTLAGDAVALAAAVGAGVAHGGDGRRGRAAGAGRRDGWAGELRVVIGEIGIGESGSELLNGDGGGEVGLAELTGSIGLGGLGVLDPGGRESTAHGDVGGAALAWAGRSGGRTGDVEDVELAAGSGLDGEVGGGVVRNVVSIDDVVVPVSLTGLEHGALEAEVALPGTGLGSIPGERQLAVVVVPGPEEVDGLDIRRSAEREVELDGGHYCRLKR